MGIKVIPQAGGTTKYIGPDGTQYTAEQLKQMELAAYNSKNPIEKAMVNQDGSYTLFGDAMLFVIFTVVVILLFFICRYLFRRYSPNVKSLINRLSIKTKNIKRSYIDIILSRLSSLAIIIIFIYWFIGTFILDK